MHAIGHGFQFCAAFMLYWFLGVLMDGPAALLGWGLGVKLSPHFDKPYLSTSVSNFWSGRWNLTVGNALRHLCYDPVHEGATPFPFPHSPSITSKPKF